MDTTIGGPIACATQRIRFRHTVTGRYLCTVSKDKDDANSVDRAVSHTSNEKDPHALFQIFERNSKNTYFCVEKAFEVRQGNIWLKRCAGQDGSIGFDLGMGEKKLATSFVMQYFSDELGTSYNSEKEAPSNQAVCLKVRQYFNMFLEMTELPQSDHMPTLWPSAYRGDMELFSTFAEKSLNFSYGFPLSDAKVNLSTDKGDAVLRATRQALYREHGVLEVCLRIIEKLTFISDMHEQAGKVDRAGKPVLSEEKLMLYRMGYEI